MASGLAAAAAFATAPAEARDRVFWSVDVAAPGVATSVSNYPVPVAYAPPAVVYPAPVVAYPAPVVYAPPPVFYRPRPVVVAPAPVVVYRPWYGSGWGHGHHGHHDHHGGNGRGWGRH
jgi:hypothetical protein